MAIVNPIHGYMFEYQAPATLNRAGAMVVQNIWYEVGHLYDALVYSFGINIEDTNETLQGRLTVDGVVITSDSLNATHSTDYYGKIVPNSIDRVDRLIFSTTSCNLMNYSPLQGRDILIEVRKTTAAGAGNLTSCVQYGVLS